MNEGLTPIEIKLYELLQDGEFHSITEIKDLVLGKKFCSPSLVPTHVGRLKKKLVGKTIEHEAPLGYRLIPRGLPR